MIKLNKRLKEISNLVDERVVADVGCDHGKIVLNLFQNNKIDKAVISDISQPSLQKAIDLLNKEGFKNFKSYVCDGLRSYSEDDDVKQIIISGMGGLEIIQILKNSPIKYNNLILQPQRNNEDVKRFLNQSNFEIVFDKIIEDKHKFYNIIKAKKSSLKQELTDFDLLFGKDNFIEETKDFENYLIYFQNKYKNMLNKLNDNKKCEEIKKLLKNCDIAKQLLGE